MSLLFFGFFLPVALSFQGKFFSGVGEGDGEEWLGLLETARAQYQPNPTLQDISWLYNPTWNGFVEGPTWSAWWTQNSYGTTLSAAPWLEEPFRSFTYNANGMWFEWEGDGKRVGLDDPNPAPDGCLCDAAQPNGAYYKQGDGNVPIHDWALEESLSAVIMQAELLLIDRSAGLAQPFIPLFNRTLNLIESRRDPATGLLFAGTSSNLLAPSYGAWLQPNGTRTPAFLTGLCVSYVAALDRVIELDQLAGFPDLALAHGRARAATLSALPQLLAPSGDYFVKYKDPNGTLHGVLGQASHGYIEAIVNHDAVALGVAERVRPGLGEAIMARLLGDSIPANPLTGGPGLRPFDLVITSAASLDDMEYPDTHDWLWNYGTWVNGGEWATCEARQMLAYSATHRANYSLASMRALMGFASIFRMDSPLVRWGSEVYQPSEAINTVFDMWAIPAALIRGLWQPVYALASLTLTPSLPQNLTQLAQHFPLLWGGKRLLLSASGNFSLGIQAVTVNGQPWASALFTPTTLTLPFDALAGGDNFTVHMQFPPAAPSALPPQQQAQQQAQQQRKPPTHPATHAASTRALRGLLPSDAILWLDAASLAAAGTPSGARIGSWANEGSGSGAGGGSNATQAVAALQPTFLSAGMNGRPAVAFDGRSTFLEGGLSLPSASSTFAVFKDGGTVNDCCTGVFYSAPGCNGLGTKAGPSPGTSVLMIDWSGSGDCGLDDLRGHQTVAAVVYNATGSFSFADGCLESLEPPQGAEGERFMVGSRNNEQARFFNGTLSELLVFPRSLNASEMDAVHAYLAHKWPAPSPPLACGGPAPNCTLPPPLASAAAKVARFVDAMREGGFPDARFELAHALLVGQSVGAWEERCAGLGNGTVSPLPSRASNAAANAAYVDSPARLAAGLEATLEGYKGSADPSKQRIYAIWSALLEAAPGA
jgi:hypothetical protein